MLKKAIIVLLFGIHIITSAQTTIVADSPLPREQVNLVLDRDLYLSGETIWFKASINMEDGPEAISNILYIELFNHSKKSIVRKKFEIKNGTVSDEMEIPSEFLSETYFLRAYTNYNRNFPSHFWYYTSIQVINAKKGLTLSNNEGNKASAIIQVKKDEKELTTIYYNLPKSFVSQKAHSFLSSNNQILKEGSVLDNGWGKLTFNPVDSLTYELVFTNALSDTIKEKVQLHNSYSSPVISDLQSSAKKTLLINKGTSKLAEASIVLTRADFHEVSTFDIHFSEDGSTSLTIPENDISYPGLYFVLLKDPEGKTIAIHTILSQGSTENHPKLDINEPKTFKRRQKVSVNLDPISQANISSIAFKAIAKGTQMSAIDKLAIYIQEPHLLLTYLRTQFNPLDLSNEELDICLTQIDKTLNTEDYYNLLDSKPIKDLNWIPEIRDVGLSGILLDKKTQKPVSGIPIYLSVFKDHPQIHIYDTRSDGSFIFSLNRFENNQDIFLCPLITNGADFELKINTDFAPTFPELKELPLTIDSSYIQLLEQLMIATETNTRFKINSPKRDSVINHIPYSFVDPKISIVLDDYVETPTMEMVLQELVPNLGVRKKNDVYSLKLYDAERKVFYTNPLVLVDNIPIFDINELLKVSPKVVEKVELLPSPFILGDHDINGIVTIKTKSDDFGGIIMPSASTFFEYQTLNPEYVFKANSYDKPDELQSRLPDFRTLLFWEPSIEKEQQKKIDFYTSDQTSEYEAIIFGTYKNGQPFQYKLFNFSVTD